MKTFSKVLDDILTSDELSNKRRKIIEWKETLLHSLRYDPESKLFELDSNYLAGSGLPSKKLILYCRPTFHQQFEFLQKKVIEQGVLGWILGPPGTGKSTTALAFASCLDRNDWIITWIHLSRTDYPVCVRLHGHSKKSLEFQKNDIEELDIILKECDSSKKHIVIIDGYVLNGLKHVEIQMACYSWLKKDRDNRRLVVVCSMSSRGKTKWINDQMLNLEEFFVYSWKKEEYLDAIKQKEFFGNVKNVLDSDLPSKKVPSPENLVLSKLYFAGGSARWMFLYNTKIVIEQIDVSVSKATNIMEYIDSGIGELSDNVVNRLFSTYLASSGMFRRKTSIASQFAGVMVAIKAGPELIRRLAEATRHDGNPVMDGWMLEMWFFSSIRHCGVQLLDRQGGISQSWPKSNVDILDVNYFPSFSDDGNWFKPKQWNQGGYDAIFIHKSQGIVKFVQVTGGNTHSFKIGYFHNFLDSLRKSKESFEITSLDIIFLVEQTKHASFKLEPTTGEGLLEVFGWEKGKEISKVKIFGLGGWMN